MPFGDKINIKIKHSLVCRWWNFIITIHANYCQKRRPEEQSFKTKHSGLKNHSISTHCHLSCLYLTSLWNKPPHSNAQCAVSYFQRKLTFQNRTLYSCICWALFYYLYVQGCTVDYTSYRIFLKLCMERIACPTVRVVKPTKDYFLGRIVDCW